ncbi:MAG: AraC family transcriptional regulator [Thermoguttaceae bacterium]
MNFICNKHSYHLSRKHPRVFVNVETTSQFGRDIIEGVLQFSTEHNWQIDFEYRTLTEPLPEWLNNWNGDGIISRSGSAQIMRQLEGYSCPFVELVGTGLKNGAEVCCNGDAMAQLIFYHFRDQCFQHFAFYSFSDSWWTADQKKRYVRLLRKHRIACHTMEVPLLKDITMPIWHESAREQLRLWLHSLPKPICIYAVSDSHALPLLQTCLEEGIAVPEEVVVVGVDNDEWLCRITTPPLSSVDQNGRSVGYLAAELLQDRMNGKRMTSQKIVIEPTGLICRQSSDRIAINDAKFISVLRYIRENACRGVMVSDIVTFSKLSHATLVRQFRKYLGRTIEQEVCRLRLNQAKQLLLESDINIRTISNMVGFRTPEYFCSVFHKQYGIPPNEFRIKHRQHKWRESKIKTRSERIC